MNANQANELVFKPSLLLRGVRLTVFCLSFFLGEQIVRSGDGKIPFYFMFVLPAVTLIPLLEAFICKITLSTTGIEVRSLTQKWSIDWNQITSWKYFNNKRITFYVGNKRYSLMELEKCSALKHSVEIKDWIKKHVKRTDSVPALHTDE